MVCQRLVPAGNFQPQAADEKTLAGNHPVPGSAATARRASADDPRPSALSRPRRNHRVCAEPGLGTGDWGLGKQEQISRSKIIRKSGEEGKGGRVRVNTG